MIKFVYLQVGSNPKYRTELRYSIATLLADMPEAAGNIIIYTDSPLSYAADSHVVSTHDVTGTMEEMTNRGSYFFRAKPCVALHALRTNGCPCVFLDTDTFMNRGFARALKSKLSRGAVMDSYLRRNPFPECAGLQLVLPSGVRYSYDPKTAVMYNSGVIGVLARTCSRYEKFHRHYRRDPAAMRWRKRSGAIRHQHRVEPPQHPY